MLTQLAACALIMIISFTIAAYACAFAEDQ